MATSRRYVTAAGVDPNANLSLVASLAGSWAGDLDVNATINSVTIYLELTGSGWSDDSWGLTGADAEASGTVRASVAFSGSGFTNSTQTFGPTADNSVATAHDINQIDVTLTYAKTKGPDGGLVTATANSYVEVDYTAGSPDKEGSGSVSAASSVSASGHGPLPDGPTEVRSNSGIQAGGTTVTVAYGAAPSEGNAMIAFVFTRSTDITTPAGWLRIAGVGAGTNDFAVFYKVAGASEGTSQVFTVAASDQHSWVYYEYEGVDQDIPIRAWASQDTTGLTTSRSSGTTSVDPVSGDHAIAAFAAREDISAQSFTNSFTQDLNIGDALSPPAEITTAQKDLTASGAVDTTMSWTTSSDVRGLVVVLAHPSPIQKENSLTLTGQSLSPSITFNWQPTADNLLVVAFTGGNTTINTPPSGWTAYPVGYALTNTSAIYYKIAAGNENGTSVTFAVDEDTYFGLSLFEFSGIDTTTPTDQNATNDNGNLNKTLTIAQSGDNSNADALVFENMLIYDDDLDIASHSEGWFQEHLITQANWMNQLVVLKKPARIETPSNTTVVTDVNATREMQGVAAVFNAAAQSSDKSGSGTVSATSSTSATGSGEKAGSGSASAASSTSATGDAVEEASGFGSVSAASSTSATGNAVEEASGSGSVSAASSTSATGTATEEASGSGSVSATSSTTSSGESQRTGSGAVSAASATSATGDALEEASGSGSVSAASSVSASVFPQKYGSGDTGGGGGPPTFVSSGTFGEGLGAVTVGMPSGAQAGDILILHIEGLGEPDNSADPPPTGGDWNLVGTVATGTTSTSYHTRNTVYWAWYDAGINLTVPDAGNHTLAIVTAWRGVDPTNPQDVAAVSSYRTTALSSHTIAGLTTVTDNSLIVVAMTIGDDVNITSFSNANLSDVTSLGGSLSLAKTSLGSQGAIGVAHGLKDTAGAIGDTTATTSTSERFAAWVIALRPGAGTGHTSSTSASGFAGVSGSGEVSAVSSTSATGTAVEEASGSGVVSATSATSATGSGDRSGTASTTAASSTSATAVPGKSGAATTTATSATSATGTPTESASGSGSVSAASSVSAVGSGERSGSGATSAVSATSATGENGRSGSGATSATSSTSATGDALEEASGTGTVSATSSTSATATADKAGAGSTSATSATSATGENGRSGSGATSAVSATSATGDALEEASGTGTVSATSSTSATATADKAGAGSTSATSATSATGENGRSGSGATSATSSTSATGVPSEGAAGSGEVSATSSVSSTGFPDKEGAGSASSAVATSATGFPIEEASGSGEVSAASSASATGTPDKSGTGEVSAASATSATGTATSDKTGSGEVSAASSTSATGEGQRTGLGEVSAAATTTATGEGSKSGAGSVSATSSTTAFGTKDEELNKGGAGEVSATTSVSATGQPAKSGDGAAAHASTTSASGVWGYVGSGTVAATSSTAATGEGGKEGSGSADSTNSTSGTGTKSSLGSGAVAAIASTIAAGLGSRFGFGDTTATSTTSATGYLVLKQDVFPYTPTTARGVGAATAATNPSGSTGATPAGTATTVSNPAQTTTAQRP